MAPASAWRAAAAACAALALRAAVALWPHSGEASPPMHGDFEAQRHWMEITAGTPLAQWYVNTTANDLLYWGLDYPPLTAYASWAFGRAAAGVGLPQLVALGSSRGHESPAGKLYMRATVLLCDVLVYLPAVVLLLAARRTGLGTPAGALTAASLALLPGLLLVDHGHFQYNGVSLGLALAAFAALYGRPLRFPAAALGALCFSLALNYKQMELYHAPVVGVVLAAAAARGELLVDGGLWRRRALGFAGLALVVITVFVVLWAPFCVATVAAEESSASWTTACGRGLTAVLTRLFPFDRSLFEDKVANLWCALEPLTGWRRAVYAAGMSSAAGAVRGRIVAVCTCMTAALMLPALVLLLRLEGRRGKTVADVAVSGNKEASSAAPLERRSGTTVRRRSSASAARRLPQPQQPPPAPSSAPPAPRAWAPGDVTLLASFSVALAFFLASYQVHEKSVLLPALPAAALAPLAPLLSLSFGLVSTWSLWPLLAKDGLLLPAVAVSGLYAAVTVAAARANGGLVAGADAAALQRGWATLARALRCPGASARPVTIAAVLFGSIAAALLLLSAAAAVVPPPPSLPDLHPYLSAVVGAGLNAGYMVWGWSMLATLQNGA